MKNNKKLKIAMLGHKRIPSREGGVEIVVEELSTRMAALGHGVTCYNRSGHHVSGKEYDNDKQKEYKGVRLKQVFTIDFKGLAAMTSSFFAALRCAISDYDIVHFHAEGPCAMLWLPKLFGKKCVATIHGLDWQRAKWGAFASNYIKFGEKIAVKYADEIIVLSSGVQQYFLDTYGRKTVFIPNGVTKPIIYEANLINKEFGLQKDDYVLYLGRLVPEKGIQYLIKAFKNIETDKKLVIAGGSSDTDDFAKELKGLAKEDNRIIFTGFVQGRVLGELYSNAYVYVLPSDLEGMPLSLLEAMSYGNCCLTSDITECAEVVEDKAILFKKADIVDLKEKLQYVCSHADMVSLFKAQASEYICTRYNWLDVVKKTMELYR
ncbi:MAG: glycosyltransferase family 4 protein [Phascolarctobacterium sp.]|nr:glycosyltransferase family 4 protein [Phascolarctobacterium sp.]